MTKQIRVYVSHSIRGKFGKDATGEQMRANCQRAINFGHLLRLNFPRVDWYIPADHEDFVHIAWLKKYINEAKILEIDCEIISQRNGLILYAPDDYISGGMQVEKDFADKHNVPSCYVLGQQWQKIREYLETLGYE